MDEVLALESWLPQDLDLAGLLTSTGVPRARGLVFCFLKWPHTALVYGLKTENRMVGGLGFLGAVPSTPWRVTDAVVTSWEWASWRRACFWGKRKYSQIFGNFWAGGKCSEEVVKPLVSLAVFTKLHMEMLRQEEGLQGLKTCRFLSLEAAGCVARWF